jgi:hypothetical protein
VVCQLSREMLAVIAAELNGGKVREIDGESLLCAGSESERSRLAGYLLSLIEDAKTSGLRSDSFILSPRIDDNSTDRVVHI